MKFDSNRFAWYSCSLIIATAFLKLLTVYRWLEIQECKGLLTIAVLILSGSFLLLVFTFEFFLRKKNRISLKELFWVFTAMTLPLAWLAHDMRQAGRQRDSLVEFQKTPSSWFRYSSEQTARLKTHGIPTKWMLAALGDDFFYNVEWLDISGTSDGFEWLADIRYLYGVNLRQCEITDSTLALLRAQPYLKHLGLDGTPITDAGLSHLHKMSYLETVWLRDTSVSLRGIQQLKVELPKCTIWHSHQPPP